jgi:predicted small lipoprotein YifL
MKTTMKLIFAMLLAIVMILSVASCGEKTPAETTPKAETPSADSSIEATGLWASAKYLKDTTVGEGAKSVLVDIEADGKKITLTIKTDKATLGEALYENEIINDASFFDTANGIKADWNANQAWWKVCKGGETTMVGVNDLTLTDGDHYEFIYTIGY